MPSKVIQNQKYQTCIDTCNDCMEACEACVTECLREQNVNAMTKCIQLCRECAEICVTSSKLMSMDSSHVKGVLGLCIDICDACSQECRRHQQMEHCKLCAQTCRRCVEECRKMVG